MKSFYQKYLHNSIVFCVLLAVVLNFIIESVSRRTIALGFHFFVGSPMTFFYNALIIFATLSVAFLVRRRYFVYLMVSLFWLIIGVTNGVILGFRTTPFTVTDLSLLDSVRSIIPNYLSTGQIVLVCVVAVVALVSLILAFFFMPKRKTKVNYKKTLVGLLLFALFVTGSTNLAISQNWVSTYFDNLNYAYNDYGFPYCFLNTWLNTGISAPKGYSAEKIKNIFSPDELPEVNSMEVSASGDKKMPNIVMLQLESFFDPALMKEVVYSTTPAPNFARLKEEYSSGFLTVPVLGAGTANTEFEVMSGMRVRFFGPGEYPYKSVLVDNTCETVAFDLKQLGYGTHAIHNHRGAFYGRNKVFANLGFDTFTSLEYMNNVVKTPKNWAKDSVLTEEILAALSSTEGSDYIYTVSVQGHGQYPTTQVIEDPVVTAEGLREGISPYAYEYYLQQIYEMDVFIGELTSALEEFEEDTVLVMYGDHLPSLGLRSDDMENDSVYQTEYVIWDNFGLAQKDQDLYAYQLSAEVLDQLGIHHGVITTYHQKNRDSGNYLENLRALQFDMLYGKQYIFDGENPFQPTKLKMGVKDIQVDEVLKVGNRYYIKGKNFTPFSKVSLDDKVLDTIFLRPTVLGLREEIDPKKVVDMKVSQVEKNNAVLSTTE